MRAIDVSPFIYLFIYFLFIYPFIYLSDNF